MPEWFVKEMEEQEARVQVNRDTWRSNEFDAGRRLTLGGALLGAISLLLFWFVTWLLVPVGLVLGALGGFFIHVFEFGALSGAVVFAVLLCLGSSLAMSLLGHHPASVVPLIVATTTFGALLGICSESSRAFRRGA